MSDVTTREPYIFCIGFNKCGTSALHAFFHRNGIASVHWDAGRLAKTMLSNIVGGQKIFQGYDQEFRAFSDMTFLNDRISIEGNAFFRVMDADYPDSLFIYTTRDIQAWVQSRRSHTSSAGGFLPRYMSVLNTDDQDVVFQYWIDQKLRFEKEIADYFSNSSRFLKIDIASADVPRRLGDFLGRDVDPTAWAMVNTTEQRNRG